MFRTTLCAVALSAVSFVSNAVETQDEEGFPTVYIVEARQIGYLPDNIKEEIGW